MKKILFAALFTIVMGGSVPEPMRLTDTSRRTKRSIWTCRRGMRRCTVICSDSARTECPGYVRHEEHRAAKRALNCEWKSGHRAVRASRGAAQYSRSPAGVVAFQPAPPAPTW